VVVDVEKIRREYHRIEDRLYRLRCSYGYSPMRNQAFRRLETGLAGSTASCGRWRPSGEPGDIIFQRAGCMSGSCGGILGDAGLTPA